MAKTIRKPRAKKTPVETKTEVAVEATTPVEPTTPVEESTAKKEYRAWAEKLKENNPAAYQKNEAQILLKLSKL